VIMSVEYRSRSSSHMDGSVNIVLASLYVVTACAEDHRHRYEVIILVLVLARRCRRRRCTHAHLRIRGDLT